MRTDAAQIIKVAMVSARRALALRIVLTIHLDLFFERVFLLLQLFDDPALG